jgi:hypothetical protein
VKALELSSEAGRLGAVILPASAEQDCCASESSGSQTFAKEPLVSRHLTLIFRFALVGAVLLAATLAPSAASARSAKPPKITVQEAVQYATKGAEQIFAGLKPERSKNEFLTSALEQINSCHPSRAKAPNPYFNCPFRGINTRHIEEPGQPPREETEGVGGRFYVEVSESHPIAGILRENLAVFPLRGRYKVFVERKAA